MNINRKALLLFIPALVFSAKGETLDEMKTEYNEIIEEQEYTMTMLEENYSAQDEIKAEIAELDSRLSEAQVDIDRIDVEMAELLLKINEAREDYDEAKEKSEAQYEKTAERLRFIYENEDNYFEYLSKCGDAEKYSFYKQYIVDIIEYDTELLEQLKETELYMQEKLDEIKKSEEAKAVLQNFRTEREFEMTVMYEERSRLLDEYRQDAEAMEAELKEINEASERVRDIIINMEENEDFVNTYTGGELEWPIAGRYYVSSDYCGRTSPVGNGYEFHTGIDIPAPEGYEISAAEDGIVTAAGWINGYGYTVIINHGGGVSTLYGHNSELLVSEGDTVERGETIALCGSTGYATGSHCHFEVRINGEHTNPWEYLKRDEE